MRTAWQIWGCVCVRARAARRRNGVRPAGTAPAPARPGDPSAVSRQTASSENRCEAYVAYVRRARARFLRDGVYYARIYRSAAQVCVRKARKPPSADIGREKRARFSNNHQPTSSSFATSWVPACLLQPANAQFAVRSPCVYKYIDSRRARARSIVVLRECGERTRTGVLEAAIVPARRLCPRMLIRSSSTRRFSRTAWNWWKRGNTTHAYFLLESSARTPPVLRVARRYSPAPAGCIRRFLTTQLKQPVFSSNFHSTLTVDIVNQIIHIKSYKYLFNSISCIALDLFSHNILFFVLDYSTWRPCCWNTWLPCRPLSTPVEHVFFSHALRNFVNRLFYGIRCQLFELSRHSKTRVWILLTLPINIKYKIHPLAFVIAKRLHRLRCRNSMPK